MTGLPPQIVQSLVEETSREEVAKLLDGYRVRSRWTSIKKEAARRLLSYSVDITICFIDTINFQKDMHCASVAGVSEFIGGCKKRMCSSSNVYTEMFKRTRREEPRAKASGSYGLLR